MTPDGEAPLSALQRAQLEQVELQNEKLQAELADIRRGKPWFHGLIQFVPIVTALVAIAGFSWGIVQYRDQQTKNRDARAAQALEEAQTAEREFMKPWLASQREIYLDALSTAAEIANADDSAAGRAAIEKFWRLYQGKMILVETTSVSDAMVHFGKCLSGVHVCDKAEMNARCRALATVMASSMAATAKMTFKEFAANQFKYSSGP